jgi:hypothetical protein
MPNKELHPYNIYLAKLKELDVLREENPPDLESEEDALMEEMDFLWYKLTPEEQDKINALL